MSMRAGLTTLAPRRARRKAGRRRGLLAVDDAMRASSGFGLDAVRAVLTTLAGWPVPDKPVPPIASVRRADLVTNVAWPGLPEAEIEAPIDACTLTTDRLCAGACATGNWKTAPPDSHYAAAGPTRPGDRRRAVAADPPGHATMRILVRYLDDGRLPWPTLSHQTQTGVRRLRRTLEDGLEDHAHRVAEQAGPRCSRQRRVGRPSPIAVRLIRKGAGVGSIALSSQACGVVSQSGPRCDRGGPVDRR